MSECKHSFNLNEGKFCKYCGINFDDLMRNIDVSNLEKERDELQAQVAVLRGALESLVKTYISNKGTENQFVACITPPHGTPAYWKNAINALDSTPSEASEHVNALVGALESIVKEDKNETTYEENFGNVLSIAKRTLAEWRN